MSKHFSVGNIPTSKILKSERDIAKLTFRKASSSTFQSIARKCAYRATSLQPMDC